MEREQEVNLVDCAKKDPEEFGILFDHYYPPILRYVVRRTANVEIAQDIASETFFKAFRKLHQFQWRKTTFGSWLYAIATNELRQYYRKHKRPVLSLDYLKEEQGLEIPDTSDLASELIEAQRVVEQHEAYLEVQQQIVNLPVQYQEVLALRFFEDKKITEIVEILGKKEGTIKSLLSRGLEKLRQTSIKTQPIPSPSIILSED